MKYEKNVVPVIEANYDNFTASEKRVADFLLIIGKSWTFQPNRLPGCCIRQKRVCHVLQKNADLTDIVNLFIGIRRSLRTGTRTHWLAREPGIF